MILSNENSRLKRENNDLSNKNSKLTDDYQNALATAAEAYKESSRLKNCLSFFNDHVAIYGDCLELSPPLHCLKFT